MKLPTTRPNGRATIARSQASLTTTTLPGGRRGLVEAFRPHSWMYWMSCLKPVTPVIPGTSTGL
jgi:hypothetical protein